LRLLEEYIREFLGNQDARQQQLGRRLERCRRSWDVHAGGNARRALRSFVAQYNWFGVNKGAYNINQNMARNLVGALMQDYLVHLMLGVVKAYPTLDVFTEVRVPFGTYPLWASGGVTFSRPAQQVDVGVGYRMVEDRPVVPKDPWPRRAISQLSGGEVVMPVVVINSKIRVSQSEFFDWLGRDELLAKGNPSCLSAQVALRSEMDLSIVEAAQAKEKFFLLGSGGEANVVQNSEEVGRLVNLVEGHLRERMT